jgi:hypothetical protein
VASLLSLSEEEQVRLVKMNADVLNFITGYAAGRDGKPDAEPDPWLLERRKDASARLDADLALNLADRLGEDALRKAVEESTPPSARGSIDALVKQEGGMLPVVKNRIGQARFASDATVRSDAFGCGLGAFAIVAGVALDGILGGIAAVGGIVLMASEC